MNIRHTLIGSGLVLALVLVVVVLPVLAQDGGDCPACPVSFGTSSILNPFSAQAAEISQLFTFVFWMAAGIFVLVESLLIYSVIRFRNRPASQALQVHGNTKLEIAWTAFPALILAVLLGFTLRTMAAVRAPVTGEAVIVRVVGHQWWWEFSYPELGIVTANQMVVPVGKLVKVELASVDVQHGFWAPQLFGKMDAIPGHLNRMSFTATQAGEYGAQCTQLCGEQHAQMRFSIVAVSPAEFQQWAAAQQQPAAEPTDEAARRGQQAFLDPKSGCIACHTIDGTAAAGKVGPNLTHLASRRFIAGGILPATPDNLRQWIANSQIIKPGNKMPNFSQTLDSQTIGDIAAYLSSLK